MPDEKQALSPSPSDDGAADPGGGDGGGPAVGPAGGDAGTSDPGYPSSTGSGSLVPDESMSCDAEALPDAVASVPPSTPPQEAPSVTAVAADGEDPANGEEAAAEEAALAAAVGEEPPEDPPVKRGTDHVSSKYTEEQLMARHYGMSMAQAKRVKALLTMGVCEEDLAVADRLLKLGSDTTSDTPLTKEEQLLGYTNQQRQRMKALHTLGLTEEALDRCRSIMLSSLGPSAFGMDVEQTAERAANAARDDWTPEKNMSTAGAAAVQKIMRMKALGNPGGPLNITEIGRRLSLPSTALLLGGAGGGVPTLERQESRRASLESMGIHLPSITAGRKKPVLEKGSGATGKERVRPLEEEATGIPVVRRRESA